MRRSALFRVLLWYSMGLMALPAIASPSYQIVSGHLPPLIVEGNSETPGALTEIVHALAINMGESMGEAPAVQFHPWARAVFLASSQPRTLIMPLTRTSEREDRFRWVVKLYRHEYVFTALKIRGVSLESIDALRQHRIGVLRGAPSASFLKVRGFTELVFAASQDDLVRLLQSDKVDAIYGSDIIARESLRRAGQTEGTYVSSKALDGGDIWLGGSKDFTEGEVAAWQSAMQKLVADGGYRRILARYGLK